MGYDPANLGRLADPFGKKSWNPSGFRRFLDPSEDQGCDPSAWAPR